MSQFIEMFSCYNKEVQMSSLFEFIRNGANIKQDTNPIGFPITRIETIADGYVDLSRVGYAGIHNEKYSSYFMNKGDILVSHINSMKHIGKCALYDIEGDGKIIHGMNLLCLRPIQDIINPIYALYFLRDRNTRNDIMEITKPAVNQVSFSVKDFGNIRVILPTLSEQQRFAGIAKQADKSKFSDFKSQFIEMFGNPLEKEYKWPKIKLGQVCEINPRRTHSISDNTIISFIPMQSIKEDGTYEEFEEKPYIDVKKGFTYCEDNDVLFAKITPCMENGKGAVLKGLTNGIGLGSTEFHVLRSIEGKTNPTWLYCLTKLDMIRQHAVHFMTGTGGQKRVPADYFNDFEIGLPPIELQKQFEVISQQADKSKSYGLLVIDILKNTLGYLIKQVA